VKTVLDEPDADNASFRMVVSYWDMAAAMVNHGAIDEQLFADVHAEHVATFAKVQPFLADLRAAVGNPEFLGHLERLVMRAPNATEQLARLRERSRELGMRSQTTTMA
jgi:hypothetical protein